MSLPKIAIVGRPNVGKSSLLNRLARRRVSIVDATPGVTRDRVSVLLEIDAPLASPRGTPRRVVEITDTGGYGVYTAEGKRFNDIGEDLATLTPEIERQIAIAIAQADIILFVLDAQSGITSLDETIATLLRRHGAGDRVLPVANKVDGDHWIPHGMEAASQGFGEPVCISATSGFGTRHFFDVIYNRLPAEDEDTVDGGASGSAEEMKIAIVGRRNAGKSTLINQLAGEPRVIVSEIAGTTRDSVDVRFEIDGRTFLAIDTAGVRKRKSFENAIEFYAYRRMLDAVRRADVVMFMIDGTKEVSQVDKKLSQELQRLCKPSVIVINKWDLVDRDTVSPDDYLEYLTKELAGLSYAPIVFASAETGDGLQDLVAMAFNLYQQAGHRETTGRLNNVIGSILDRRGPSSRLGTHAKLLYVTQIGIHPPTIAMIVNDPKIFRGQYERYLMNRLREELSFSEVPIRILFRKRKRMDLQELKDRGAPAAETAESSESDDD